MDKAFTLVVTGDTAALFHPLFLQPHADVRCTRCTLCPQRCTPLVDVATGAGKIRDNGDMCCLALVTFVIFCHTQKTVTMLTSGALVVSFFLGMNRFQFGDTTVTDWV